MDESSRVCTQIVMRLNELEDNGRILISLIRILGSVLLYVFVVGVGFGRMEGEWGVIFFCRVMMMQRIVRPERRKVRRSFERERERLFPLKV